MDSRNLNCIAGLRKNKHRFKVRFLKGMRAVFFFFLEWLIFKLGTRVDGGFRYKTFRQALKQAKQKRTMQVNGISIDGYKSAEVCRPKGLFL